MEWELWTSSNDGCGNSCDIQLRFKKEFRDTADQMEKVRSWLPGSRSKCVFDVEPSECRSCELQAGQALFTPHYSSRQCTSGLESEDCQHNCIHYGRYCSMDSIGDAYKDTFRGWQVRATLTPVLHSSARHLMIKLQVFTCPLPAL